MIMVASLLLRWRRGLCGSHGLALFMLAPTAAPRQDTGQPAINGLHCGLRAARKQIGQACLLRMIASLSLPLHPLLSLLAISALLIAQTIPAFTVMLLASFVVVTREPT
jgi:hypothetical protein